MINFRDKNELFSFEKPKPENEIFFILALIVTYISAAASYFKLMCNITYISVAASYFKLMCSMA